MVRLTSWRFRDTENLKKLINILLFLPITIFNGFYQSYLERK